MLRPEKLHTQQNCRKHNAKHQQGIRILLPALLVRIFIFGQETSCCVQFPHCNFSANASTARLCLWWMLDFLLSRSFLDASGVRRAGTVRADAGIPILPVFIFRLQTVAERRHTCASSDSEIPGKMPPWKHLRHRIETSKAPLATPWMTARNSRRSPFGSPAASHAAPPQSPHTPSMSAENDIHRTSAATSPTGHAGQEKSIAGRSGPAARPGLPSVPD